MRAEAIREKLDGLVNPLLVKEMYQSLHNRKFLAALWLMLGCSLVTYVTVYAGSGEEPCGDNMFGVFAFFMYVACVFVLPFLAFSNLEEEVKSRTIELVHITRMTARKHVRGRLLASLVKIGLIFSMVGPFAVAAFLFKGIGVFPIIFTLCLILLTSVVGCAIGIFFAALTSITQMRHVAKGLFILILLVSIFLPFTVVNAFSPFGRGFGGGGLAGAWVIEALFSFGAVLILAVLAVWFLCAAAANTLTFEANKCSSRTKFIVLVAVAVSWAMVVLPFVTLGEPLPEQAPAIFGTVAAIPLLVCGLFWLLAPDRVPYRFQRKFKRRSIAYQALMFPLTDGTGSTTAFLFIAFGLVFIGQLLLLLFPDPEWRAGTASPVVLCAAYALFFSALTHGIVRLFPERFRTPKALKGAFLILLALNFIVPAVWAFASRTNRLPKPSPVTGLFPLVHFMAIARASSREYNDPRLLFDLFVPLTVGLIYHITAMARRFGRYMGGQYK